MKILVTGFDPFDKEKINPAWEAVKRLPDTILDSEIIKLEIPTVQKKSVDKIKEAMDKYDPDVILSIGQAGGRYDISVERIGINIDDYRIKDNDGNQPVDNIIIKDAPAAYFSTIPVKKIVEGIKSIGIPASVSNTAGTFVCNHVLYSISHLIEGTNKQSGFIHIPYTLEQVVEKRDMPSMSTDTVVLALKKAIEIIIIEKNK